MNLILGCTELSVLKEKFPLHANGLSERFIILESTAIVVKSLLKTFM